MIACLRGVGANWKRCLVVLVGGARMFALGGALDIGARNDAAVRAALASHGLDVHASATGGNRGRTVRVVLKSGEVVVQEAGGERFTLLGSRTDARPSKAGPIRQLKLSSAEA